MFMGEMDIGLRPDTISTITQVVVVDLRIYQFLLDMLNLFIKMRYYNILIMVMKGVILVAIMVIRGKI